MAIILRSYHMVLLASYYYIVSLSASVKTRLNSPAHVTQIGLFLNYHDF